ncbi:MAG: sulfatase-like hydrolase/transferase [Planctomycetota bacterium]|nr:sulfatase-like hydrolase/transferase [Planctomycetota bacterium]MDA1214658.1 sulfatase-like hydrolase/transferase [Planctomycetota bacterium]
MAITAILFLTGWLFWSLASRPTINVLLITLDTTRADRLGAWNGPQGLTPVLDGLASHGIVFERAFAPVPLTLPSHASLMTGVYPPEHGLRVNSGLNRLGSDLPVLSEILREHGYRTGAFVGAFVLDQKFGLDRGFDIYDDEMEESHGPTPGDPHGHKMRIGERVVDSALTWLAHQKNTRFFCWVHLFDPHTPYDTREELFGDRFHDRPYDAGIAYVDRQVGRLLEFLRRNDLDENTLIIVVGDHGESLDEHQERTHGFFLYDATLHVPLIMRWPDPLMQAKRISTPVTLVDIYPTLLSALAPASLTECSGRSLLPACRGETLPVVPLYAESNHPFEECGAAPLRCLITDRWKYIRSPRQELYDMQADRGELQNQIGELPAMAEEFERVLQEREYALVLRDAPTVVSSPHEKRMLASLGYAGGGTTPQSAETELPDIKDAIVYYNMYTDAQELLIQHEYHDASVLLKKVVSGVPHFFQAWFNLGYCLELTEDLTGAEAAYRRAVEIDANATAQTALGAIYLLQNLTEQAIPPLENAVALQPNLVRALFLLGEAYRQQKRWDDARKAYLKVLALAPDFQPAQQSLLLMANEKK